MCHFWYREKFQRKVSKYKAPWENSRAFRSHECQGVQQPALEYQTNLDFAAARAMDVAAVTTETLSLSLRFNGHFPGEPGLAGVY